MAGERLRAVVDHLHRPVRVEREQRGVDLHREVLPAAERAADSRQVDAHLLDREPEARRDLVAVDVEPLRCHVDVDAALAVRDREARLGAEERLILDAELVDALDDDVPGRVGIAVADHHVPDDVRPRIVAVAVAHGRTIGVEWLLLERALHVDDGLERLVLHDDRFECAPGLFGVLGRDDSDRLADVAHPVDRQHGLVGELEPVRLPTGDVRVRQDCVDAGLGERWRDVEGHDPRVRVRAAKRVAPEHPRRREVARVRELAPHLRDGVVAEQPLADLSDAEPRARRGDAHRRSAASRTASKIFT